MSDHPSILHKVVQKDGQELVELIPEGSIEAKYVTMQEYREIIRRVTESIDARLKSEEIRRESALKKTSH